MRFVRTPFHRLSRPTDLTSLLALGLHEYRQQDDPPSRGDPVRDIAALVGVFNRHRVDSVIIGGAAAQFYVAGLVTHDVDFTPATDADNLARLSAALTELQARIRTDAVPEGLVFAHDAASLARLGGLLALPRPPGCPALVT